ncbi:MAG: SDR family NAD(P)-dependent oxidoreductase [Myxococcaceae bacterium]|nr:SDR family NAD(P)-dependent oxidoreductase [Myxococcaceae bacterium]
MGRSLVLALSKRGCEVAASDIDEAGLAETQRLAAGHARVTARRLDVANGADVRAWAREVVRDHGRVNLVFNNAGIAFGSTVQDADEADFRRLMEINFWGVVHGTQAFLPLLEASGDGHVVNVSSVFGLIAFPGHSAYNAAKFAVRGYTESLRIELDMLGSPVTATCVHPGGVKTNIARSSKVHPSLTKLGVKLETASAKMEEMFKLSAEEAAEQILRGVAKNARRVLVGGDAWFIDRMQRWLPEGYQRLVAGAARRRLSS